MYTQLDCAIQERHYTVSTMPAGAVLTKLFDAVLMTEALPCSDLFCAMIKMLLQWSASSGGRAFIS
jgi:hypothetical protein